MVFLIEATMAATFVMAAAAMPTFDVEPSCRAAAQHPASPGYISICRNTEQKARAEIARQWPQISAKEKAECVPTATMGDKPTYTELLTCLELARDVRKLHENNSTTTGQGQK